jgi:signal transduction histidine kinase
VVAARRILQRVDAVTETVSGLGTDDLTRRMPEDSRQRDEIGRLVARFNQMLSRIEGGVQSIRTLSDALAHDLKSPLTAIRGNLELAMSTADAEESRDTISRSIDDVDRLLRNLEASLDVTEAEAGALRLHREPVDLREFIEQLVDLYRPAAEEHGLEMVVRGEGNAQVSVDVNLIGRALSNLLDNALSHLHSGRRLVLNVVGSEHGVSVIYQDNGPGFPEEIKDRAFQRFVKGPASHGHGLGLAVVHAAAHAHGGHAHLSTNPTGGAQITLLFPH